MCVLCIGEDCPQVIPRPTLSLIDLSIPIIQRGETSALEEEYNFYHLILSYYLLNQPLDA